MSQAAPTEAIGVGTSPGEGSDTPGLHDIPRPEQSQISQGQFNIDDNANRARRLHREDNKKDASEEQANFSNRSNPLYNMYVKMTEEEDSNMTDRWQKDGDGILIFTGLFAAALAALLTVSVQDLRPNPQDTSAATFYLANIYQLLADPNVSRASILATPAQPPPFSPPKSAVWVNSLWFLSLVIALTCALLATMLQQWGRRFVTITHPPRYSRYNTAPIRAFFDNGVKKFHLRGSVEGLTALLHLSLFLFFSGLIVFLFNIDHTVFSWVASWVGLAGCVYGFITVMPIFWHDSPYYAPLSSSAWFFYNGTLYTFFEIRRLLSRLSSPSSGFRIATSSPRLTASERAHLRAFLSSHNRSITYRTRISRGLTGAVQETGSKLSAEINTRILIATINALDQEKEFEQFFAAVPRFWNVFHYSDIIPADLSAELDLTIAEAFAVFLSRCLSTTSVSKEDSRRRVVICVMAADTIQLPQSTMNLLGSFFSLGGIDILDVSLPESLSNSDNRSMGLCSQGMLAGCIARWGMRCLEEWMIEPLKNELKPLDDKLHLELYGPWSQDRLRDETVVSFVYLIHITGLLFRLCLEDIPNMAHHLTNVLSSISKLDLRYITLFHSLPHRFCALWNEISQEARDRDSDDISFHILRPIRHLYIALHKGTDAAPTDFDGSTADPDYVLKDPFSYPLCNIPAHHPDSTRHPVIPESTTRSPRGIMSSSLAPTADHRRIDVAEELSLHDVPDTTPTVESFHPSPPVIVETEHSAVTSLDPSTIPPTSKSESDPHPISAVSESPCTSHPPLIAPYNKTIDPLTNNADLGVFTDIPLSTFSAPAPNDPPPANTQSSLAISLTAPQGTSVSLHPLASDTASFTDIDRPE